ncbi:hypothetical protein IWX90DRAFT_419192 [Phyllosticta citrichinensis]|uniref:Uncharacterized protein n=1 Tax=Phyllosticta citrichinensis TaxID=1130410 RepID=A0ABR1XFQ7_9PEZI
MSREAAIHEWAAKFETNILSKPEFAHLRPARARQDVNVEEALGAEYETTSLSECALAVLRPLKSLCTRYPSERGERAVLNCLTSAVIKRFVKGKDKGVPGLILEDVVLAEELAAEVMRRSGSVEHSSGEYQLAIPQQTSWSRWCTEMLESQPLWPKRADFTTKEQYDDAMGLVEQEWWETWVNAIEKNWGCYVHDAIPVHLREPIAEQKDEDHVRLLRYNRHDGSEFDTGGRTVDDYRGPMDWTVSFTYHLLMLSHMIRDARHVGLEWMTEQVKARLEAPRTSKQPWLTLTDFKKIVKDLAVYLDANKKVDTPMED